VKDPSERYKRIGDCIEKLKGVQKFKDFNLLLNPEMARVEGKILNPPQLAFGTPLKPFSDYEYRKVPHCDPLTLRKETWAIMYASRAADLTDRAIQGMKDSAKAFKITVEDPQYIEVPDHLVRQGQGHGFVEALKGDLDSDSKFVVVILD